MIKCWLDVYTEAQTAQEKTKKKLFEMMEKIENLNGITHMLIFGDFNFPEINWKTYNVSGGAETIQQQFYELHQDFFFKSACGYSYKVQRGPRTFNPRFDIH